MQEQYSTPPTQTTQAISKSETTEVKQTPSVSTTVSQEPTKKDSGKKVLTIILIIIALIIAVPVICFLLSLLLGWKLSETELESTFKTLETTASITTQSLLS